MADFIPLRCSASFKLNAGTNPETGKPIYKTITISGVDPDLAAANFSAAIVKLPDVLDYPLADSRKSITSRVE